MPKKILAEQFGRRRLPGQPDGTVNFVVEYLATEGPARSGKAEIVVTSIVNREQLKDDLKAGLVAALNAKYAPETFRAQDVLMT